MTEEKYLKMLGERITGLREKAGLSVYALAVLAELTPMHVYRIEAGKHVTGITILRRIAYALDVDLGEMVKE